MAARLLLVADHDAKTLTAYTSDTGKVHKVLQIGSKPLSLAVSPDSTCIALGTSANTYLLDPATLSSWKELDATRSAFAMAFSPNGRVFAAAGRESIVYLYYLPSYSLSTTGKGHKTGNVYGMCFSPSSDLLITGADDNTVILWEVEHLRMLRALSGHTSWVYSVVFINDEQFASASADHSIRFWNSRANSALKVEDEEHTATVRALAMFGEPFDNALITYCAGPLMASGWARLARTRRSRYFTPVRSVCSTRLKHATTRVPFRIQRRRDHA